MNRFLLPLFHLFLFWLLAASAHAAPFDPGRVGFAVTIDGNTLSHRRFFATALPRQNVALRFEHGADPAAFAVSGAHGKAKRADTGWSWRAPATPGIYPLAIEHRASGERMVVQMVVMVPAQQVRNGNLNGYPMGAYPQPLKGMASYRAPLGFIEVTEQNRDTPLSPHFTLGQFLCKQSDSYPQYIVLQPSLLMKLEALLAAVNADGFRADSLVVMSGYRTPNYNRALGNTPYSRHVWGDAADVFVDVKPKDGRMDDLNRDGKVDREDAAYLYRIADRVSRELGPELAGGVGEYDSTSAHGPFVHVDTRGSYARWGHAGR